MEREKRREKTKRGRSDRKGQRRKDEENERNRKRGKGREKKEGKKRNGKRRMEKGRVRKDKKWEVWEENRKREGKEKKKKPPKTANFTKFLSLRGHCTHPIPDLGQIWHLIAGPWYTLSCQILSCILQCILKVSCAILGYGGEWLILTPIYNHCFFG